jgi:hypothetical protein
MNKPIRRSKDDTLKRLREMHRDQLHNTAVDDHYMVTLDEDAMVLRSGTDVYRAFRVVGTRDVYGIQATDLWDDRLCEYC